MSEDAELASQARELLATRDALMLATVNEDGSPEVSYAPFVQDDAGNFFIYVSELARHTGNLLRNERAAVMFIEDEADARQPFARTRLSFDCRRSVVARDSKEWQALLAQFAERFGGVIDVIRPFTLAAPVHERTVVAGVDDQRVI